MKIIKPGYTILTPIQEGGIAELKRIEEAARTCYKSEDKISPDGESAKKLVKNLIQNGHEAMLEHSQLSVKFICDRGVSHELVRHRIASYAQESTRYCNYMGDKFGNELTFVEPCFWNEPVRNSEELAGGVIGQRVEFSKKARWRTAMRLAEAVYIDLIEHGATPQEARTVLPNSLKTEIVVTANYREWRTIFKLRCAKEAHPQMRELMVPLCLELQEKIPIIFDDCYPEGGEILERDANGKPIRGRYTIGGTAK